MTSLNCYTISLCYFFTYYWSLLLSNTPIATTNAAKILRIIKALFNGVFPFLEFGDSNIAFWKIADIFSVTALVPDNFSKNFWEVCAKKAKIFFMSFKLLEPKFPNATKEKPSSTMDLSPPIILKYSSITILPE